MFSYQEQISAATKTQIESQLALFNTLTSKAFEGVEKMIDLNMTAVRSSFDEVTASAQQLLAAKDPQEFFSVSASQAQPTAEKALAYGRHLAGIFSTVQTEIARVAEEKIAETNRNAVAFVEEVSKNAPAGTENAVAIMKSAMGNSYAGFEQLSKTTKQAVEAFEANVTNATQEFSKGVSKTAARATKK